MVNKRIVVGVVFLVSLIALSLQFTINFLCIGDRSIFRNFQMDSEQSVRLMVERVDRDGWASTGGMMLVRDLDGEPYKTSWGLQGKVITAIWIYCFSHFIDLQGYFERFQLFTAIVLAFTLCSFALFVYSIFGAVPAVVFLLLSSMSVWMVHAGRNIYLCYWVNLLPFMLSMVYHPLRSKNLYSNREIVTLSTGLAVIVFLKSLISLDYCSNVVMSAACGSIFWGSIRNRGAIRIFLDAVCVMCFCALAVWIAILFTAIQAGIYDHSLFAGFNELFIAASSRSYGLADISRAAPQDISLSKIIDIYLTVPVIAFPFNNHYRIYLSIFALIITLWPLSICKKLRDQPETGALILTAWWGLFSTASWAVLMKGHMAHHLHMNGMIFYIPYALIAYILIGCLFSSRRKNA